MALIAWSPERPIIVVDVRRSLAEAIATGAHAPEGWIVLERHEAWRAAPYFYAYLLDELQAVLQARPNAGRRSALEALDLHERGESHAVPQGTTSTEPPADSDPGHPSASRVVVLGSAGRPVDVGQIREGHRGARRTPPAHSPTPFDDLVGMSRGPAREGAAPPPAGAPVGEAPSAPAPVERVDAILSAQGPQEIAVGADDLVDVRIELSAAATPLVHAQPASIHATEPISIILSAEPGRLEVVGPRLIALKPPSEEMPSTTSFPIRGLAPGAARVAVMFRQGASDLGTIAFATTVVTGRPQPGRARGEATASPRDEHDDDVLVLLVDEERIGDTIQYRYRVCSKALDLNFNEFLSDPVKPVAAGGATAAVDYVESLHRRIVDRVLVDRNDLSDFDVELEGLGVDLCRQLFSADFVRKLWDRRGDIVTVQITSWEPYIPWEMLRLQHPDTREVDARFLAEYGLVRAYSGNTRPRVLRAAAWRYLIGEYPEGSLPRVAAEEPYLTRTLPPVTRPEPIEPTQKGLLAVLAQGDFDVVHISCHGRTDLNDGQHTELVISDRRTAAGVEPVTISAATVAARARLAARAPLVFLNACETGRQTASLTRWGGWSRTFLDAGAGAFVGTSWSVYDKPAARFAEAFYDALRAGQTLAEAAVAGRQAARKIGGASWLAYVVYGNPNARVKTG